MELNYLPKVPAYRNKGNVFNIFGQISILGFDLDPAHPMSTTAGLCRQQERLGPDHFPPKLRIFPKTPNCPPSQQGAVGLSQPQFLESLKYARTEITRRMASSTDTLHL